MPENPLILAVDTSCDETAVAVVWGRRVLANVLASQVELHKKYGGVYPIEAKRAHEEKIDAVVIEALKRAEKVLRRQSIVTGHSHENGNPSRSTQASGRSDGPKGISYDINSIKEFKIPDRNRPQKKEVGSSFREDSKSENELLHMWEKVDAVAVTVGPGLAPALEVGIRKARELAELGLAGLKAVANSDGISRKAREVGKKKLIAVNHMEGHLLSCLAQDGKGGGRYGSNKVETEDLLRSAESAVKTIDIDSVNPPLASPFQGGEENQGKKVFPALGLLVSGGHTEMVVVRGIGEYEVIGKTIDDAAGECLDKVARMLGLGYPGGAIIEKLAKEGDARAIPLPVPMKGKPGLDFSFSGLKTAALYAIRAKQKGGDRTMPEGGDKMVEKIQWGLENLDRKFICDMCASVQRVVIEAILYRLGQAIEEVNPKWVWLGGGVGANGELKNALRKLLKPKGIELGLPYSKVLWGDNAAMIGVAGYFKLVRCEVVKDEEELERRPRWELGKN